MSWVAFVLLFLNLTWAQEFPPAKPPVSPNATVDNQIPVNESSTPVGPAETTTAPVLAAVSPSTEFVWDPTGKRDPFRPYKAPRVIRSDSNIPIDPLSLLDVNQVTLVAVLWNTSRPRAIIQDGGGARYTVFRNTKIGTNSGVVAEIREGEVVVVETFDDGFGNVVKEPKVITMKKNFPKNDKDQMGNLKDTGGQNAN